MEATVDSYVSAKYLLQDHPRSRSVQLFELAVLEVAALYGLVQAASQFSVPSSAFSKF